MACDRTLLSQAYLDGELDPAAALAIEAHLAECAECSALIAANGSLSAALRQVPRRHAAPHGLEARIQRALDGVDDQPAREHWRNRVRRFVVARRQWLGGAAAGIVFAGAVAAALVLALSPSDKDEVLDELAGANTRTLIAQHPVDIESSDVAKLRPWFTRRVALAPPIADLSAAGFQLVGGRAEFIDGKRVAALIYLHDTHYLSLLVWSSYDSEVEPGVDDRDGYHLVMWTGHGLVFCAVSDESVATLQNVAKLINAEADRAAN